MNKRLMALAGAVVLGIGTMLSGCGGSSDPEDSVTVMSVAMLTGVEGMGGMGVQDRYAGVVVSQTTHDINKDEERKVQELKVAAGQTVKKGDVLFVYDTDEMKLAIETGKLELEKLQNTIENTKKQIQKLTEEKAKAKDSEQLSYSIEIQTLETDNKENEYRLEAKKASQAQLEKTLENGEVTSPIDGVVQSINEKGETDEYGNTQAYIVLMETGNYRVKGTVNEMNRAAFIGMEGETMLIRSRADASQVWEGTLEKVDTENPVSSNSEYSEEDEEDSASQSTQYPFYVTLDNSDGLMMGQHVYIELDSGYESMQGLWLEAGYLEIGEDGSAWAWVANDKDKLERRSVTLGEYDEELEEYQVTEGLAPEDYVAIYDISLKEGMSVVRSEGFDEEDVDFGDEEVEGDEIDEGDEEASEDEWDEASEDEWDEASEDEGGELGGIWEEEADEAEPIEADDGVMSGAEGFDDVEADLAEGAENYDNVEIEGADEEAR